MKFDFFDRVNCMVGRECSHEIFINSAHDPKFKAVAKRIAYIVNSGEKQRAKKNGVPIITWQASYAGHRRTNDRAIPSGLYIVDFDHTNEGTQALIDLAVSKHQELDIVYVGRSISSKGVRVVAECRPEFSTLIECQQWLSQQLGQPFDSACKDWARSSYIVPEEYIAYMDYGIFQREPKCVYTNPDFTADRYARTPADYSHHGVFAPANPPVQPAVEVDREPQPQPAADAGGSEYRGMKIADIATQWLENTGGIPVEGERNTRLYNLAYALRYICDFNPHTIAANIPLCGLPQAEVLSLCKSACSGPRSTTIPRALAEVLERMQRQRHFQKECASDEPLAIEKFADVFTTDQVPELPPIFKQWYDAAPDDFKQAAVLCLLPFLGTLGSRLRAVYMGDEVHSPSFQVTLEAPQAQGKSFIRRIDQRCMGNLKEEDARQRKADREWKEKKADLRDVRKGANKDEFKRLMEEKPEALIRYLNATASTTELLKKMDKAQGLHLFAMSEEIDTVQKAMKRDFSNFSDILRKAFDNAEHGQDYASENSWSGIVKLYYNCLYCGTPKKVRRFYPDVEDGTVSRVLFVTFPDQSFKPKSSFRPFTESENAELDIMLQKLQNISMVDGKVQPEHMMKMDFLVAMLTRWCLAQQAYAAQQQDRTRDTFCRRSSVMGFRAGMLAFFLLDETDSDRTRELVCNFAIWVANSALRQFLSRFDLNMEDRPNTLPYKELYDSLPDEFGHDEIQKQACLLGITSKVRVITYRWRLAKKCENLGGDYHNPLYRKIG